MIERAFIMAHNFTNSEMCDMVLIYGECGRRPREAARLYARRYPEREQPDFRLFTRLELGLRENGQFRRAKPAGTYLFIKFSGNTILNILFLLSLLSYFVQDDHDA